MKGDAHFIDLLRYNPVSMTTVSTHDSDTLEIWWTDDPRESKPYAKSKGWSWGSRLTQKQRKEILWDSHHSSSLFHINLIGEYLALFDELVWDDPQDERINFPGTVSDRNWTYRICPSIEKLTAHQPLKEMIRKILP
jgi:4-alpha-glucanotransferase